MSILIENNLLPLQEFHSPERAAVELTAAQAEHIRKFNDAVNGGRIAFELTPCLCGGERFDLVASVDRFAFLQKTVICIACGLIQSNPRMTEQAYQDFYKSDLYRKAYDGDDFSEVYAAYKFDENPGIEILEAVSMQLKVAAGTRVLELGAGAGWNLVPFNAAGADVIGLDYSPELVRVGLERGLNMQQGSIGEIDGEFDIIILNHVVEHFLSPVTDLEKIARHLRSDGLLYVGVPNIRNFSMSQLQNAHTYSFTPETLHHYCARAGLELITSGAAANIHQFGIFRAGEADSGHPPLAGHYEEMAAMFGRMKRNRTYAKLLSRLGLYGMFRAWRNWIRTTT